MKYEINVSMQNCSLQYGLQFMFDTVSDKMYIFGLNSKNSNAKREYSDENVFLQADSALGKLNFFHLKLNQI